MNIVLLSRSVPCLIACFIAASGLTYIQMDLLYGESSTVDAAESDAQKNVKCKETKSRAMSYSAAFCEYGTRESRVLCMPAIVPAPAIKEDGLYTHPVSAMQIISVEADGKPIYARKYDIDNDEMEFDLWKTFTPSGSMHCYLITMASNYYEISSPKKERIFRLVTCNEIGRASCRERV